ncbi:hypothetical protein AXG53_03675 [Stenotrophomonas sp. KCTC 12332]|nr:hypothetical protein AXG53_03675 [Stenotrophomonas sp. KCTC 12332]
MGEARCLPQNAAHAACGKLTRADAAMAPALEEAGAGIGGSFLQVDFTADDGQYVNSTFNQELDCQLVRRYALSLA